LPDWVGLGEDDKVDKVEPPITPMQAYVSPQMLVHPLLSPFHATISTIRAPVFWLITSHVSPDSTKKNLLQFFTIRGCTGIGVETPLPDGTEVVGEGLGEPPIMPTQAYVSCHKLVHALLSPFAIMLAVPMPYFSAIVPQLSPDSTKWKVLQLLTIPGRMGEGVATPLLEVGVVLLAMTLEVVGWTGEGDQVGLEVGVLALELDELGMPDVFWVVVGAGSLTASTQKLLPDTRPEQSAPTEGFLRSSQFMQVEGGVLSLHTQRRNASSSIVVENFLTGHGTIVVDPPRAVGRGCWIESQARCFPAA
jgi:hypothetical protein